MQPALRLLLALALLPLGCVLATPDDLALRGAGDTGRDVVDVRVQDAAQADAPPDAAVPDAAELVDLPPEVAAPDAVALHDAPDATDAAVGGDAVDAGEAPGDAWGGDDAPDAGDAAPPADAGEAPDAPGADAPMGQDASDVPAPRDAGMADVRDAPSEVDAGDAAGADGASRDDGGVADTGPTCAVGEVFCGGRCADLRRDPANCGACGRACQAGDACEAGVCGRWAFEESYSVSSSAYARDPAWSTRLDAFCQGLHPLVPGRACRPDEIAPTDVTRACAPNPSGGASLGGARLAIMRDGAYVPACVLCGADAGVADAAACQYFWNAVACCGFTPR